MRGLFLILFSLSLFAADKLYELAAKQVAKNLNSYSLEELMKLGDEFQQDLVLRMWLKDEGNKNRLYGLQVPSHWENTYTLNFEDRRVGAVQMAGDGNLFAALTDKELVVFDREQEKSRKIADFNNEDLKLKMAFSGDGKSIAVGGGNVNLQLYSLIDGQFQLESSDAVATQIEFIDVSFDGNRYLFGDRKQVLFLDKTSGQEVTVVARFNEEIKNAKLSSTGKFVALLINDNILFRSFEYRWLQGLGGPGVKDIAFSKQLENKIGFSRQVNQSGSITLLDLAEQGVSKAERITAPASVGLLALSGKTVVTSSGENQFASMKYNPNGGGDKIYLSAASPGIIKELGISLDEYRIFTSEEHAVRVWDLVFETKITLPLIYALIKPGIPEEEKPLLRELINKEFKSPLAPLAPELPYLVRLNLWDKISLEIPQDEEQEDVKCIKCVIQ